jgi:hypothetical protein
MQAKLGTLSLEAQSKLDKEAVKKEAKAEAKADAAMKKKMVRAIILRRFGFVPALIMAILAICRHRRCVKGGSPTSAGVTKL